MQEFEMIILISTVCEKNGHNNQIIKEKSRKLTKLCYEIYDKKALYRLIVEIGVKQKNLKAVSECLEELSDYIQ
jgi:predicted patatin/cPLA2 family phospholipase